MWKAIITLLVLDILWINFYMGGQYRGLVKNITGSVMKPNMLAVVGAYILMVIGLVYFVLPQSDWRMMALFGGIVYGVYNLTNASIFNKWDKGIMIKDIMWGMFVYTVAGMVN